MCGVCGCGEGEVRIDGEPGHRPHAEQGHRHRHERHRHEHHHHAEAAQGGGGAGDRDRSRWLHIEQDILAKNDAYAAVNRSRLDALGVLALNLVSSPGAGKTSLLTATARALSGKLPMAVIEGDQETENDAARIRATGIAAVQINTGRVCHLDGHMIGHAMSGLELPRGAVLFIENVGNLVCPAAFDLGEHHKVAILSVTEGDDKPLKYPDMFAASDLMILNKTDLLPYVDFDVAACIDYARRINPDIEVLRLSARGGEGLEAWFAWLAAARARVRAADRSGLRPSAPAAGEESPLPHA
jgi:hydrogenase nickel incorporation protein HypB